MQPNPLVKTVFHGAQLGFISLLLCLVNSTAQAAPKCDGRLTLPDSISLPRATSQELVGGVPGLAIKRDELSTIPSFNPMVRRSLPNFWQSQVAADDSAGAFDVQYEMLGVNGCQNCLSHSQKPSYRVLVTLEPLPVTVLDKPGNGKNCRELSGGVNLILDLQSAQYAGTYQGQLRVTVTRF